MEYWRGYRRIAADRELVDAEIHELESSLENHRRSAAAFPLDVVLDRVSAVLADRRVTEEGRADLLEAIESLQGGLRQRGPKEADTSAP